MQFSLDSRQIGLDHPPLVVAKVRINHFFSRALRRDGATL
ncbi:hypothetical protein HAL013_00820 [Helicobacter ailurogastricus]|uniref:Uncharacterized protein n=1 Tax=Helicobacter ailurogastricus TaxID=1578720 RepID=A0A0K2X2Z4_9HELI|nr:hypothetical protein HAL011_10170 [Helicobacter ailurogastricus]CRF41935.1 hypothetical protein HAL013_00820 [Helicobacter ailurogastricus]CRF43778.1 hypothetical protein HAL09_03280 [Helicobacter ailurogastricus]